ncbi:hypothetical protein PMAYCL1PPCAC_06308, partial [Pristionchus mayeri]
LFILLLLPLVSPLKFLCYSPRAWSSHSNFFGKLADSLIAAGHEVVILSPTFEPSVREGSELARVIQIPKTERYFEPETNIRENISDWVVDHTWQVIGSWTTRKDLWVAQCHEEKFDAAFAECIDWCSAGIFHLAGIEKFAITESFAQKDGQYPISHMIPAVSYVPTIMGGHFGDDMTFAQRAFNLFNYLVYKRFVYHAVNDYQEMFEQLNPGFPNIVDLISLNSLYFMNYEPLLDFPRPSSARVIDIGGIVVSSGHKPLNQTWSSIMDLRPRTVLMSFGTVAEAQTMPEAFKESIRAAVRSFPDVTFIWKYEKPAHNVSRGIPNLIETTWVPQNDMLHDSRLSLFITHCGQGSTTEANYAGVPLVVVPVLLDQVRNAYAMKRAGVGIVVEKSLLATPRPFTEAIRELLNNSSYKERALSTAQLLRDKPFSGRELFVRNMKFLAVHGPLRMLDHHGRKLTFIQYYLIDIIGATIIVVFFSFVLVVVMIQKAIKIIR